MDLKDTRVDESKEVEGVWVDVDDVTSLLIARMGNPRSAKRFSQVLGGARASNALSGSSLVDGLENEDVNRKLTRIYAETILLDWKGLYVDGVEVPYSLDKCEEILGDPQFKEFRTFVINMASAAENYRQDEVIKAKKKPETTLSG